MILLLSNGKQIRGDLIGSAILRQDLAPIPVTLEADIRTDDSIERLLVKDETISLASGDQLRIIKSQRVAARHAQGAREVAMLRITALSDACHPAAFVRRTAVIKEGVSLASIYRACGASLRAVDADFQVPRFYCPVGDTPTFHIARVIQEEGGVVRWKGGKLQFLRLEDLFRQKAVIALPANASDDVESGFLERHEVPWFFSLDDAGGFVFGNREKPRVARFSPFKDARRLRSMTSSLIHRKTIKVNLDLRLVAGELVEIVGGDPLCIVTAAHVFEGGANGGATSSYSRLWLSSLER